jgi:hypothetical protein
VGVKKVTATIEGKRSMLFSNYFDYRSQEGMRENLIWVILQRPCPG